MKQIGIGAICAALLLAGCEDPTLSGNTERQALATFINSPALARQGRPGAHGCFAGPSSALAGYQPGLLDGSRGWGRQDKSARSFSRDLNRAVAGALRSGDAASWAAAKHHLLRFADANAWREAAPINSNYWAITESLGSLLPAWSVIRLHASTSEEERSRMDRWIQQLARRAAREQKTDGNHVTMRTANEAFIAATLGDHARLERILRRGYDRQIRGMRSDGSFPFETRRGQMALVYTARNTASLVLMAEIGENNGISVYARSHDGRTIRDAIRFLIAAYRDNSLVDGYARANMYVPQRYAAFTANAQQNPFDEKHGAWILLWANRFPNDPLTRELLSLYPASQHARVFSDVAGGNVTCYVGWRR